MFSGVILIEREKISGKIVIPSIIKIAGAIIKYGAPFFCNLCTALL
jgi:hypothetical protein